MTRGSRPPPRNPGLIETEMADAIPDKVIDKLKKQIPVLSHMTMQVACRDVPRRLSDATIGVVGD